MDSIPYTRLRADLANQMDRVCEDHVPLLVTRKSQASVVMISLDDYESMEESAYLLRSPKNARRIFEALVELEEGSGTERELAE